MSTPKLRNDCFALPPGVDWTPVDEALALLSARLEPVTTSQAVAIPCADGRILVEDVRAARAHPPFMNAAVDGYGFAHQDIAGADADKAGDVTLPLQPGRAAAGAPFEGRVQTGHALRILTGARVPDGIDTVILEEDIHLENGAVRFQRGLKEGANTRPRGEDITEGDTLFRAGQTLGPPDLAVLASSGVLEVMVRRPLTVAVLSTGDELAPDGVAAGEGQIPDANRPMLGALARRWGHRVLDLGQVRDDADAVRARLDEAATSADALLTTGGASAGDEDHISAILKREGSMVSWRIALKPGRPLALGMWRDMPVFGLPGNPVAAFVCALMFARPALGRLAGGDWSTPRGLKVPAAFSKRKKPGRREYLRARLTDSGTAEVFASEGSGRVSGIGWADGLVELPDGAQEITPGTMVTFLPYRSFGL